LIHLCRIHVCCFLCSAIPKPCAFLCVSNSLPSFLRSGFKVGLASDVLNYATEPAKSQRVGGVTDVGVAGRSSKENRFTLTAPDVGLDDSIVTWPATPVLVKRSSHRFTVRVRVNSNLPDGICSSSARPSLRLERARCATITARIVRYAC